MSCPTCGAPKHCYGEGVDPGKVVDIPPEVMDAGVAAAAKYLWAMPRQLSTNMECIARMVEDIHRAMHNRRPLPRDSYGRPTNEG